MKIDFDTTYGYLCDLLQYELSKKSRIFERDNSGRDSVNLAYSDGYMKSLGKELALREVIKYLDKLEKDVKTDEKQIPKKVVESDETHCPSCNAMILTFYKTTNYCLNCGQLLKRED